MEKLAITKTGFTKLEEELKHLKMVERPRITNDIAVAREHGDLKENAEYKAAREEQGFTEGRIQDLEARISRADIIDVSSLSGDTVIFGATVTLENLDTEEQKTYQIVSEYEADIDAGRIANTSPIARSILGKDEGDAVEVFTPGGVVDYEVIKVEFK